MNYKLSMATILVLLTTLNADVSMTSKSNEHNNTKQEQINEFNRNEDPETKALALKERKLSLNNTLLEEELKSKHTELLMKLQKLRWEKELLAEELELKELKAKNEKHALEQKQQKRLEALEYLSKVKTLEQEKLTRKMEFEKAQLDLNLSKLQSELEIIESSKQREKFVDTKPAYLENPLTKENKLIISDRRVLIDGIISRKLAKEVSSKINYFNNKDKKKPIFIVINHSNGGSAMAGYLILKAMEGSDAPIYVVLREYAASMAAIIVTLADKSYAYAHASIMHHQPLSLAYGNLTQQKEDYKRLEEWWIEFGGAIAKKMGITLEAFKKEMYKHNSNGDWEELAVNAQKLKWVNTIVDTIVDTSVLEERKKKELKSLKQLSLFNLEETVNEKGKVVVYLPRASNGDVYFLHNPSDYYQFR